MFCCEKQCPQMTVTSLFFLLMQSKARLLGLSFLCTSAGGGAASEGVAGLSPSFFKSSRSSAFSSSALSSSCLRALSAPSRTRTSDMTLDSWPFPQTHTHLSVTHYTHKSLQMWKVWYLQFVHFTPQQTLLLHHVSSLGIQARFHFMSHLFDFAV